MGYVSCQSELLCSSSNPPCRPPPENFRGQGKSGADRPKNNEQHSLLDPANRRTGVDRHVSRNNSSAHLESVRPFVAPLTVVVDTDDIILGPSRMTFPSAMTRSNFKPIDADKTSRDSESQGKFGLRSKTTDPDSADRFRDGRSSNFRRRTDTDQDSDGWSTVKPRKSFGHEGAERFHGRMGERPPRDDRKPRDRDDRDIVRDRPSRGFDSYSRDKDVDDGDTPRRAGMNRGRSDPSWFKESDGPSMRERIDRTKSWRDRDERPMDNDRGGGERGYERRWIDRDRDHNRDHRVERDPEWMDEPEEDRSAGKTEADFKKFMERMKAGDGAPTAKEEKPEALEKAGEAKNEKEKAKAEPARVPIDRGPDKFFEAFATSTVESGDGAGEGKAEVSKTKVAGKSSRFTSFFNSQAQEDARRQTEPPTPAGGLPPLNGDNGASSSQDAEKEAFKVLLQKLQRQTLQPGSSGLPLMTTNSIPKEPPNPLEMHTTKRAVASPDSFQQFGADRRDDPRLRGPPQPLQDLLQQRSPLPPLNQPSSARPEQLRPEQMLQELVGQRHMAHSQGGQMDQTQTRNAEFLMTLMQSGRSQMPEPQRSEPQNLMMRMPQPQKQGPMPPIMERELEFQRERAAQQQQQQQHQQQQQQQQQQQGPQARQLRGQPFLGDGFGGPTHVDHRPPQQQQPTQILQRPQPPPLGMDHLQGAWMPGGPPPGSQGPMSAGPGHPGSAHPGSAGQSQRGPMIPPPGLLAGTPTRAGPPGPPPGPPMGPGIYPGPPPPHSFGPPPPGAPGPAGFPPGMGPPLPGAMPPGVEGLVGPGAGGPPHRGPPPGFFGGPPPLPPGFMQPPPGHGHHPGAGGPPPPPFQGGGGGGGPPGSGPPDGMLGFPFDGRGMLPPSIGGGAFGRRT